MRYYERAYQRILFGVASLRRNKFDRGKARVGICPYARARAPLESVSLCTRFSGFSTISSFGFNRLSSKLVGMFLEIVPMFVAKDFVRDCFVAQIRAKMCVRAGIRAYLRD